MNNVNIKGIGYGYRLLLAIQRNNDTFCRLICQKCLLMDGFISPHVSFALLVKLSRGIVISVCASDYCVWSRIASRHFS